MTEPAPESHAPSLALIEQLAHDVVLTLPPPVQPPVAMPSKGV